MEIKNFILGEFKESYSGEKGIVKDIDGQETTISFPQSEEGDLADAFMAAKMVQSKIADMSLTEIVAKLKAVSKRYLQDEETIKLIAKTTGSPISYIKAMRDQVTAWMGAADVYLVSLFGSLEQAESGIPILENGKTVGKKLFRPRGITSVILAGDEAGLASFVMVQTVLSRNPIVLKPSTLELVSAYELVKEFAKEGLGDFVQMVAWNASANPELVTHLIKNCEQIVLFGSDATVDTLIYERDEDGKIIQDYSKSINVIAHTTGRSASIILKDADIPLAVDAVLNGATCSRGNECVHTKKVFVESPVYENFKKTLLEKVPSLNVGDPLDAQTSIGIVGKKSVHAIKMLASEETGVLYSSFKENTMAPLVIEPAQFDSRFIHEEIPGPSIALIKVENEQEAVKQANKALSGSYSTYATATSVFGKDTKALDHIFKHLRAHKILLNKSSTSMNFNLPHHGHNLVLELMEKKTIDL